MPKPIVQAMVVCDNVYRDEGTKKSVLSGTFSTIFSGGFPNTHGHLAIYLALTDIAEKGMLQVVFRNEQDHDVAIQLPAWRIDRLPGRTEILELCGNIAGLPLPGEGVFEFAAFWNDSFLASKRVNLVKLKAGKE